MSSKKDKMKNILLGTNKKSHYIHAFVVVVLIAIIGTLLLTGSHAFAPYAAINADSGSITGVATKQSCTGSTSGSCIQFGGGGGTGTGGLGGGAKMLVGINQGMGHSTGPTNAAALGGFDRLDVTGPITTTFESTVSSEVLAYSKMNVKIDLLVDDGSTNPTTFANDALSLYKAACLPTSAKPTIPAAECPIIEITNEPDLNGFDVHTYAALVKATYIAFHASTTSGGLGSASPAIVGAYLGGSTSSYSWGNGWWNWNPDTSQTSTAFMKSYVDGVYVHPYGHHVSTSVCSSPYNTYTLSGGNCGVIASALGDRGNIIQVHNNTGVPIYITEVGWPANPSDTGNITSNTVAYTGDSYAWPYINCNSTPSASSCSGSGSNQGDQCNNVYNIVAWTRTLGYVYGVVYFGINDYRSSNGSSAYYGLLDLSGNKKPAFGALSAVSRNQANPCPNPLSY